MVTPPDLQDFDAHPRMVGWFDPPMLLDIARQAVVSAVFGQYADRRLIQASLDKADESEPLKRAAQTAELPRDDKGAVWIDYVADLGDARTGRSIRKAAKARTSLWSCPHRRCRCGFANSRW